MAWPRSYKRNSREDSHCSRVIPSLWTRSHVASRRFAMGHDRLLRRAGRLPSQCFRAYWLYRSFANRPRGLRATALPRSVRNFLTPADSRLLAAEHNPGINAAVSDHWKRISKRQLSIRPAWQIGEHDPDIMAIQQDSDPIIPDEIENPQLRSSFSYPLFSRSKFALSVE